MSNIGKLGMGSKGTKSEANTDDDENILRGNLTDSDYDQDYKQNIE